MKKREMKTYYRIGFQKIGEFPDDTGAHSKPYILNEQVCVIDEKTKNKIDSLLEEYFYVHSKEVLKDAAKLYAEGKNNEAVQYILENCKDHVLRDI